LLAKVDTDVKATLGDDAGEAGRVARRQPVLQKLAEKVPTPYDGPVEPQLSGDVEELAPVEDSWKALRQALKVVDSCTKVMGFQPDTLAKDELQGKVVAISQLSKDLVKNAGGSLDLTNLEQTIQGISRNLEIRIEQLGQNEYNELLRQKALRSFETGDYSGCLAELAKWKGEKPPEILYLEQRASFRQNLADLQTRVDRALQQTERRDASWTILLSSLAQAFDPKDRSQRPPLDAGSGPNPEDQQAYLELAQATANLRAWDAFHSCVSPMKELESVKQLADLIENPPAVDVPKMVRNSAPRVETESVKASVEGIRVAAKKCVLKWMEQALAEKVNTAAERELREVVNEDGRLFRGRFEQDGQAQLKWWPEGSSVYTILVTSKLKQAAPSEIIPAKLVTDYNRARAEILQSPASEISWRRLGEDLEKWQKDLAEYRTSYPTSVSFQGEAEFVGKLVDSWKDVTRVLGD